MAGTIEGGKQASETNRKRHGENFYKVIGAKGGKNGNTGGFATKVVCNCDLIDIEHFKRQCAGKKGGAISRRGKRILHTK
jgi:hypothetical protein